MSATWEVNRSEGYITLKLNGSFEDGEAKQVQAEVFPKILEDPKCHVVINCQNLSEISLTFTRCLLQLQREVKNFNKLLRLILVNEKIRAYLKQQGVEVALPSAPSLREALVDFGLATKKALDVNFINPFLTGTMNALKIQANTDAKPGKLFKPDETNSEHFGDISGVIGMVSDTFNGSVVISFPASTFLKIISRMLGEEYTEITKDIQDGAGELTNIIFGQAKAILNEKGYSLKTAIPSVICGKDHSVKNITTGPRVIVPFTTDVGDFYIEICMSG